MLQQEKADDFILATGKLHSVRDLVTYAFTHLELNWESYVQLDSQYARIAECVPLCGDATKAARVLGWVPKTDLKTIVTRMVDFDLKALAGGKRA